MGRRERIKPERLPEKLLKIRQSLGLTQQELIKKLNYTALPLRVQNISGSETGKREVPITLLLEYARLANISPDVLIDDSLDLFNG